MYRITKPPAAALDLARIILLQSQELHKAIPLLRKNKDILTHCVEINRLENEADVVSGMAIAQLFDQEKDPITLIKTKELIEALEVATDKAEDVANALETIVLKIPRTRSFANGKLVKPDILLLIVTVLIALVFDFLNGFHDAANSIATVVSTRVLSPKLAVVWAAFLTSWPRFCSARP